MAISSSQAGDLAGLHGKLPDCRSTDPGYEGLGFRHAKDVRFLDV